MRGYKVLILVGFLFILNFGDVMAQNVSDYLILRDIGDYRFITEIRDFITGQMKTILGYTKRTAPGMLAGVEHFDVDHDDVTYETNYINRNIRLSVEVQVTHHAGAESDRWLLHEVDISFRNYYGIPSLSYDVEPIEGNTILISSVGGHNYRWLSGNKVIIIGYTDLQMKKPQPLEVVRAYLAKHPSTIPSITLRELRSPANKTIWIKNEMERRLWLCDKWFLQLQMGKVTLDETLDSVVKSMMVFLDYREKYYGIKAKDEKIALVTHLEKKDGTSIKNKLTTYKTWWAVNKGRSITLP